LKSTSDVNESIGHVYLSLFSFRIPSHIQLYPQNLPLTIEDYI